MKGLIKQRALVLVAVAALGVVAIGGTALAGLAGSVKTFTGCLSSGDGVIVKVKEGDNPKSPCTSGQTLARLSGGDITKISVSGGLTLPDGGDSGDVTIALDPKYSLPQNCASGQVAKWNGATSAWVCAADNNTTYSSGTGLDLTGTTFSVDPDYRVKNTPDCDSGKFATGFDGDGGIQCSAPAAPPAGIGVWHKTRPADFSGGVIVLPKGEGVDLIMMPLPAGTFLVTAVATVSDRNSDEEVSVVCRLRDGASIPLPIQDSWVDIGDGTSGVGPKGTSVVHGVITLANPDTVRFTCFSEFGDSDPEQADNATMTAVKVATLH
jgi:hypothetical protein